MKANGSALCALSLPDKQVNKQLGAAGASLAARWPMGKTQSLPLLLKAGRRDKQRPMSVSQSVCPSVRRGEASQPDLKHHRKG